MPKNKGKGGKNRRRGKNENEAAKRELDLKEDGQEYAQVTKMLGNGRIRCFCFDGKERLCNIRGKMRRRVWITVSDIILVGLRDYQDGKADVIQKYNPDEARRLKAQGHIPDNIKLDDLSGDKNDDNIIVFANDGDEIRYDEEGNPIVEEGDLGIAPQPERTMPGAGGYIVGLSDIDDSDEDDSSEEDSDEDEEFDYENYALNRPSASHNKPAKKQEFSIDNI